MWKWINSFAQPSKSYQACNVLLPYFICLCVVCLPIGVVWGLAFAPTDYQQFDVYRIIYLHVPSATLSLTTYVAMATAAFVGLVWQWKSAFTTMIALAPVGAVITFISLVTGALWGKPTWGTYWFWDARLTSQLILLFLYVGVLALYSSFDDKQQGSKASAIMALVGVVNVPIIKYSVEWWNSIHQTASISKLDKPSMPPEMYIPLFISILGVAGFIGLVSLTRLKNELFKRDAHRPWVAEQIKYEQNHPTKLIPNRFYLVILTGLVFGLYIATAQGFKFDSWESFIDMNERGFFVWASYIIGFACMLVLYFQSAYEARLVRTSALKQIERIEKIQAARAAKKAKKQSELLAQAN